MWEELRVTKGAPVSHSCCPPLSRHIWHGSYWKSMHVVHVDIRNEGHCHTTCQESSRRDMHSRPSILDTPDHPTCPQQLPFMRSHLRKLPRTTVAPSHSPHTAPRAHIPWRGDSQRRSKQEHPEEERERGRRRRQGDSNEMPTKRSAT